MKGKRLSITVHGAYGESNFGDDLLMLGFENYFRQEFPDAQLNFSGQPSDYPKRLLNKATEYRNFNFPKDVLVYGGGTQFFSFKEPPHSLLYKLSSLLINPKRLYRAILRRTTRVFKKQKEYKCTAFLGIGIGPFIDKQSINSTRALLEKGSFIGVRDEVAYKYSKEWNLSPVLGADIIFSSFFTLPDVSGTKYNNLTNRKKVGIIVRDWVWKNNEISYLEVIKRMVNSDKEIDYEFIIFAPKKDPDCIKQLRKFKTIVWQPDIQTPDEFIFILNQYDAFISARYHGAIIASLLGKPVVCVEIEPKLRILTEQIPEILLWHNSFELEELKSCIKKALSLQDNICYSSKLNYLKNRSDSMLMSFSDVLRKINKVE